MAIMWCGVIASCTVKNIHTLSLNSSNILILRLQKMNVINEKVERYISCNLYH
jgi:hypothetical protein